MFPPRFANSRYLRTARHAYLARIATAGALVMLPAACGSDDAGVFGATETEVATVPSTPADTAIAETTVAETGSTSGAATFPSGAEMVVELTFSPTSSGRINNPYVAVWVEDTDGNLVQTISLWYEQSGKGARWLNELRGWYAAADGSAPTTSGATRAAGSYSVVWDGTDLDGNLVAQGDYVLYVEAAREHGPYEITATTVTIDGNGFVVALDDNGELSAVSATLTA